MLKTKLPFLLTALVLIGCAKEKEYDEVYKDVDLQKRSDIKTHHSVTGLNGDSSKQPVKYLYVPMSLGTPRKVRQAYPFFQGDEKIVRLEWSEAGLEVLELEKDARFRDNELNDSPVLTIPVEYTSYRCKEDDFGDCTNVEEENDEIEWQDKKYFVPKFEDIEVTEVNSLDVFNVGTDFCTSLKATKLKDYEISDGVINIEIERTYKLNSNFICILSNYFNDNLSSSSFKVRNFFSLVELDKLASPSYQPIDYPIADHDKFGFFKTKQSKLSPDFNRARPEEKYLVNRWNPKRKNDELVYYLSKNFNKPQNKVLLDATLKAVDVMNQGLAKIKNPFKLVVKQQKKDDKEISPGDLRYNTLVLIEDPLSNGLLGYGPSVANPLTGEIVQAHVNMYGGVLKSISRRAYEEAVDISEQEVLAQSSSDLNEEIKVAPSALKVLPEVIANSVATAEVEEAAETSSRGLNIQAPAIFRSNISQRHIQKVIDYKMKNNITEHTAQLAPLLSGDYGDMNEFEQKAFEFEKEEFGLAVFHKHKPEFFPIGGTTKVVFPELKAIKGILKSDGSLKRWEALSQSQKDAAVEVVLEKAWIGTLIHEFGHNLGLRHNFAGSFDRANFMSEDDLAGLGMKTQDRPAYSSIMDYAISEYNQLASFGNYDLAALRFAYKREVEVLEPDARRKQFKCLGKMRTNLDSFITCQPKTEFVKLNKSLTAFGNSLEETDEEELNRISREKRELDEDGDPLRHYLNKELKSYRFCTDSNAGLSSTCNRHDEGTSLTEIAKFRAERYERLYKYRNFRDGRLSFSTYHVPGYIFGRRYEMSQIRDIVEEYELFKTIFDEINPAIMIGGCSKAEVGFNPTCGMINDRIEAVKVVGDMLVNVLKTPDHICALVKPEDPKVIVEYRKLAEIYEDIMFDINHVPTSCFDDVVKNKIEKDGLEVLGENGKFLNGFKDRDPNYRYSQDRAVLGTWPDKVMAMRALFNRRWKNRSTDTEHLALIDIPYIKEKVLGVLGHYLVGSPLEDPLPFKMENGNTFQAPYAIGNDYKVEQLEDIFGWVKSHLGMHRGGSTNLIDMMVFQTARGTSYGEEFKDLAYETSNIASVRYGQHIPAALRNENYSYVDINDLTYYANEDNLFAKQMIDSMYALDLLKSTSFKSVLDVFNHRINPKPPENLGDEDKVFFGLNAGNQNQLIELAQDGNEFEVEVFVRAFGKEDGPKIFEVYKLGPEHMIGLRVLKSETAQTPLETMTDKQKALFKYTVQILASYLNGVLTDETVEFYRKQLEKMPKHVPRSN